MGELITGQLALNHHYCNYHTSNNQYPAKEYDPFYFNLEVFLKIWWIKQKKR